MTSAMTLGDLMTFSPHPTTPATAANESSYCVGGALCLALVGDDAVRYPSDGHLARQLQQMAPALSEADAQR